MKDIDIWTPTGASDDLPSTSDPLYQVALTSLTIRKNLETLKNNGISFQRPELTDFSSFNSELSSWLDNAYDRESEILEQGFSNITANLPDILSIGQAYIAGGAPMAAGMIAKIAMARIFGDTGAGAGYQSGQGDTDAIVAELQNIKTELETVKRGLVDAGNGDSHYAVNELVQVAENILRVLSTLNINLMSDEFEAYFTTSDEAFEEET